MKEIEIRISKPVKVLPSLWKEARILALQHDIKFCEFVEDAIRLKIESIRGKYDFCEEKQKKKAGK
jgi:hypothetical protein